MQCAMAHFYQSIVAKLFSWNSSATSDNWGELRQPPNEWLVEASVKWEAQILSKSISSAVSRVLSSMIWDNTTRNQQRAGALTLSFCPFV